MIAYSSSNLTQTLRMRAAGYSLAAIAERLNVGPRTLQRHFKAHGVKAGTLKQKIIDKAREDLLGLATDSEALMLEGAKHGCLRMTSPAPAQSARGPSK